MKKNNIIMIVVALIIFAIAFIYLRRDNGADNSSLSVSSTAVQSADAQIVYNLLKKMESVTLNDSIFASAVFQSLKDNTVFLESQVSGRDNPFAPVGTDLGTLRQATSTRTR